MREGMYLGAPPVNIARSKNRAMLGAMLRGGSSYGQAAGGWPGVIAMPNGLQAIPRMPANPSYHPEIAALHPLSPALAKLNLRRRFGVGG